MNILWTFSTKVNCYIDYFTKHWLIYKRIRRVHVGLLQIYIYSEMCLLMYVFASGGFSLMF